MKKEQSQIGLCPITGLATALGSVSTVALSSACEQPDCIISDGQLLQIIKVQSSTAIVNKFGKENSTLKHAHFLSKNLDHLKTNRVSQ